MKPPARNDAFAIIGIGMLICFFAILFIPIPFWQRMTIMGAVLIAFGVRVLIVSRRKRPTPTPAQAQRYPDER